MKRILLLTAIICAYGINATFAQTNLNLEAWTPLTGGLCSGDNPDGWATLNVFTCLGFPQSTFQESTDPGEGAFSARLETILAPGATGAGACSDTAGGMLSIGTETPGGAIGIPYTQKPTSVDFMYKYMPMGSDTGAIVVTLSHRDPLLDTIITDGQGFMLFTQLDTPWTTGSVVINWFTTDTPDTIAIIASSSAVMFCSSLGIGIGAQRAGTKLWLDAFTIVVPNAAPVAVDDMATTNEGVAVVIDVQVNDMDPNLDPLTTTIVTMPANGLATVMNGDSIQYTPNAGFTGNDTVWYDVWDNGTPPLGSNTAKVVITVNPVGINEIATKSQFKLYPNPVRDELNIVTTFNGKATFEIFDVLGKQIKSVAISSAITKVGVDELPEGMYLYQINDDKGAVLSNGKFNIVQ